jgi:hypothetical protein
MTADTADTADRLLATVTAATGTPAPAVEEVLAALLALRQLRDRLDAWEPDLIAAARAAGASWAVLAPVLGVSSRQAAERRYLRTRRPGRDESGLTRDQRVLAERDRRAGDRAVDAWARAHGADLRQLAGQVTALGGLGADAQDSVDRVHAALGGDDLTRLMDRLVDAHRHLPASLADRVGALTQDSEGVRKTAERRRDRRRSGEPRSQPRSSQPRSGAKPSSHD